MDNQKTIPVNQDNDLKFRIPTEEEKEDGLTESTNNGEKIEYFTE